MRSNRLLATAAVASLLALAGCDKARPLPAPADPSRGCTSCHGGQDNLTGAPPFSLPRNAAGDIVSSGNRYDNTATTTQIEVGAHTRHVARGVSCGACHVVPATIQAPNHNTGKRATVTFKELAAAGNVIPSAWVPAVHTCTNYCHGASLNHGGTNHAPDWLGGAPAGACGTCHFTSGVTPPAGHPQGPGIGGAFADTTACASCHPDTINTDGTINVAGGKHVNGQLDGGGGHSAGWYDPTNPPGAHGAGANGGLSNCTSCHGTDFGGGTSGVSCNACHATNGHPNWQTECTFCHGSATRAADATFPNVGTGTVVRANLAAPPVGSQGETNTTAYAVGAHQAHVAAGPFARAAQCSECHGATLPSDLTHVGGTVWIGWGVTAGNGVTPAPAGGNLVRWNDAGGVVPSCTNFCHGAGLAGGTHTAVKWNEGASGASCGSCHGIPLPYTAAGGWHVQRTDCVACHPGYTSTSVNVADHIFVGAGPQGLTCTSCHGTGGNPAPPSDTAGNTTGVKVGAHQKHLTGTTFTAAPLACTECHPAVTNPRHATGGVNLTWNLGATVWSGATFPLVTPPAGGSLPAGWETTPTCANYCHGGFTNGKAATVNWTSTTAMTCNSCHGAAAATVTTASLPGGSHPQSNPDCSGCHTGYTTTTVNAAVHLNGALDVISMSCTSCHGDPARTSVAGADLNQQAAPPIAASSNTAIGAHLMHVNQGAAAPALSSAFTCANCHFGQIPAAAPHADFSASPVKWGNIASAASAVPTYTLAAKTCSNTYCHGQFTGGKPGNAIAWGTGTPAKLACNACHGQSVAAPQPTYPHPQNLTCNSCHVGYTTTTVGAVTHVDGMISKVTAGCTACHGERADVAVTPTVNLVKSAPGATGTATTADTTGATATTAAGVGAHRAHLVGSAGTPRWRSAVLACTECHLVPALATDTAHATGTSPVAGVRATMTWGPLAASTALGARTVSYAPATGCAATYCHAPRADVTAGLNQSPLWTGAATAAACGSCHGLPPVANGHSASTLCSSCHDGYADAPTAASTGTAVSMVNHINGLVDVKAMSCNSCHGAKGAYTPIPGTDSLVADAPPTAADGTNALIRVGAHQAHVNRATYRTNPLTCADCHPIPNTHNGTRDAAWSPLATNTIINGTPISMAPTPAAATGFTPTWEATPTCTNACHGGNIPSNASKPAPLWTGGALTCTSCHGAPPPLSATANQTHPQNAACVTCHGAGYSSSTVNKASHVNGTLDRVTSGCTACHGELNAAGVTLTAGLVKSAPGASLSANSYDTTGLTSGGVAIGAHEAHLVGAGAGSTPRWRSTAIACIECHALPATNTDTAHATGVGTGGARATMAWGNLAQDNAFEVKTAAYAQPTCSSVYCHDPKSTDTAAGQNSAPLWTGATTTVVCGSCHGLPPVTAAHPTGVTECASCHGGGYATTMPTSASTIAQVNALLHINGVLDGGGDCTGCHDTAQTMAAGGTRRAIVPEFANAWSHKRSASPTGTVTKWDCVVCHMEGDPVTGNTTNVHKDGVINLRDPDTGNNIQGVNFTAASGASPGGYVTTATNMVFTRFSRNLAVTLEADPAAATLQAIMINQCLKCHDSNGAMSASARVPVSVMPNSSSAKPFGTTIAGATYTGAGVTANGILGAVVDVNESFKTTNSSYHPVTGKQNNWYAKLTRMVAPWNAATRGATVDATSWGPLLSCWDCHAPAGTASTVTLTATVTAHGGATTLRGTATAAGTPSATTGVKLCIICHTGYDTSTIVSHGPNSAWSSTGADSGMNNYIHYGCNACHSSGYSTAVSRPIRAQDVHGVNVLPTGGAAPQAGSRWAGASVGTPAQVDARPYAFIRNTTQLINHQPAKIGGSTYSPTCRGTASPCSNSMGNYTVGGTY